MPMATAAMAITSERAHPCANRNRDVEKKILDAVPAAADQLAQTEARTAQPPPDICREEPFVDHSREVDAHLACGRNAQGDRFWRSAG